MFLISALVPSVVVPCGRTETLASQRKLPSSMLPSQIPRYWTRVRRARRYAPASAGDDISGSLTISSSGTPERLKSTRLASRVVDVLAGVLLHVDAREPHALGVAVHRDLDRAAGADRQLVLADLIALGEIGIEVVLARPPAALGDAAAGGEAGTHRELDDPPIQHRQHAGHAEADGAGVMVGRRAELRRAAAEDLRFGQQLGVDLEADDGLPVAERRALRGVAHALTTSGRRRCQSVAASYARATRRTASSPNGGPTICRPIGRPSRRSRRAG